MATTEPPDKQDRGRSRKRRYFRRRRRKGSRDASLASEQSAAGSDVGPEQRRRSKSHNRRRSENRRRSPRRRGRAARVQDSQARPAEEENQPQTDVYIYTHVIRPTYKDGGSGEFQADHSLNLAGATAVGPPVGMEYLLDSIGQQLDAWFGLPADSTTEDNEDEEANKPSADLTDGGEAREEVHGSGQETADENRAIDDTSFSE